jgi:hypothetical protein
MRFPLGETAHVVVAGTAKQEIRVRFGRDDKERAALQGRVVAEQQSFFITLGGPKNP